MDESAIGKPFLEILPEMKDQGFLELMREVLHQEKTIKGFEARAHFLRADGSQEEVYLNYIFQPYREKEGVVSGVLVLGTDVTEQVLSRERMRKSEQRLQALVNTTPDVVFRMNADWSQLGELNGKGFLVDSAAPAADWMDSYIPPEDQDLIQATIRKAISSKSIFELEHRVIQADGQIGWSSSRAIPIIDAGGNIVEWFGFAIDISRRR